MFPPLSRFSVLVLLASSGYGSTAPRVAGDLSSGSDLDSHGMGVFLVTQGVASTVVDTEPNASEASLTSTDGNTIATGAFAPAKGIGSTVMDRVSGSLLYFTIRALSAASGETETGSLWYSTIRAFGTASNDTVNWSLLYSTIRAFVAASSEPSTSTQRESIASSYVSHTHVGNDAFGDTLIITNAGPATSGIASDATGATSTAGVTPPSHGVGVMATFVRLCELIIWKLIATEIRDLHELVYQTTNTDHDNDKGGYPALGY